MNCYTRGRKLSWPKLRQLPGGTEENYEILKIDCSAFRIQDVGNSN